MTEEMTPADHDPRSLGEDNGQARLTEFEVRSIRRALAEGESQRSIAKRFGVGQTTIGDIHIGATWGWLSGE